MARHIAVGKCIFCNEEFPENLLSNHLKKHLKEKCKTNKAGISYLVKITGHPKWMRGGYFVIFWLNGNATMEKVDDFLRFIWLECCGHRSDFTFPQTAKQKKICWELNNDEFENEVAIKAKAKTILFKGLKLDYDYDYGSTTKLQLTVLAEYPVKANINLILLSRNEPPSMLCNECGKNQAIQICSACRYFDKSVFCDDCLPVHSENCNEFGYAALPVVNSPRMGVCGYEGGRLDKERDGIFIEKIMAGD